MTKRIVICCDGTSNEYGANKTNVVRTYEIAEQHSQQMLYYDPGVGTGGYSYEKSRKDTLDAATGGGLQKNVEDAYRFLMQNYSEGDKVYLFGFSRGAFTVRSLAGMLFRYGLLHSHLDNLVEYVSKMYNQTKPHNRERANLKMALAMNNEPSSAVVAIAEDSNSKLHKKFKDDFCCVCPVHFIGVWDTVESLSFDENEKFHDHQLNPEIEHAYHAVSIDEQRKHFPPCMWEEKSTNGNWVDANSTTNERTVEQVWFAGVHSDVGGSYKEHGLSDIALRWMLTKAKKHGLELNDNEFEKVKGDPLAMQHESHKGGWKVLGEHKRKVPAQAKVHRSVKKRADSSSYEPVSPLPDTVEYVDDQ